MGIAEKIANAKRTDWVSEGFSETEIKTFTELAKISARIERCRIDMHMTQQEFAQYMGVTQVCSKLSAIALALKPYKTSIKDECEEVAIDVNAYMAGIASADCFQFPTGITATIDSLVAQFL